MSKRVHFNDEINQVKFINYNFDYDITIPKVLTKSSDITINFFDYISMGKAIDQSYDKFETIDVMD